MNSNCLYGPITAGGNFGKIFCVGDLLGGKVFAIIRTIIMHNTGHVSLQWPLQLRVVLAVGAVVHACGFLCQNSSGSLPSS